MSDFDLKRLPPRLVAAYEGRAPMTVGERPQTIAQALGIPEELLSGGPDEPHDAALQAERFARLLAWVAAQPAEQVAARYAAVTMMFYEQESLLRKLWVDDHFFAQYARDRLTKAKADRARGGDRKRELDRDGKQAAKTAAKELWLERRAGRHPKLATNEDFAREVMHRWPILTSAKVILGWCTRWERQARATPPC